jgi:hypothetical protein
MFLPRYRAARERLALGLLWVVFHVGLKSVSVCLWYVICKRNTRQTPEGPPVRCHHWTPYSIPLLTALRRFANPFRVASFGRADLTKFPWISPVTCEGETTVILADCKGIYLLPDFQSKYPHSAVRANESHTVRLMGSPL